MSDTTTVNKVGGVSISITADNDNFIAELKRVEAETKRTGKRMSDEFSGATLKTKAWNNAIGQAQGALLGLAAIGAITAIGGQILDAADKFSLMRSKIGLVIQSGEDLYQVEEELYQQAQRNRSDLNATVGLYVKLRNARKDLSDVAAREIVDSWSKTLLVSGASAQEAAAATMQFAQAMASGRLQGDELRSILENNTRFSTLLADGLGVTVGMLRKMGAEGELTTDKIVTAMQRGGGKLTDEANAIQVTVGQAWTNMSNATVRLVGLLDSVAGVSRFLAKAIQGLANAVDLLSSLLPKQNNALAETESVMKKVNKALYDTDAAVKDNPIEKLAVAAEESKDPLSSVWKNLAKIAEESEKSGAAAKQRAIDMIAVSRIELELAREKLAAELISIQNQQRLQAFRLDAKSGTGQGYLKAMEKENAGVLKQLELMDEKLLELDQRMKSVLTTKPENFKTPTFDDKDKDKKPKTEAKQQVQEYRTEFQELYNDITKLQTAGNELVGDRSSGALKSILDYAKATEDWATALYMVNQLKEDAFDSDGKSISKQLLDPKDIEEFFNVYNEYLGKGEYEDVFGKTPKPETDLPEFEVEDDMWRDFRKSFAFNSAQGLKDGLLSGDWGDVVEDTLFNSVDSALNQAVENLGEAITKVLDEVDWGGLLNGVMSFFGGGAAPFGGARASGGKVKKGWGYNVNEAAGEQFIAPQDGWVMPKARGASAASADSFKFGGLTFINNGTASAEILAQVGAMFDAHRKSLPGVLKAWKTQRQIRGDLA